MVLILGNVLAHNLGWSYAQKIAGLTRDGTFDHDNIKIFINFDNLKLSYLGLGSSHPTRHLLSLVYTARCGSSTNGSQLSMTLGTMGHWTPFEVVTLYSTLETLADGGARDINKIALLEDVIQDKALVRLEGIDGLKTELLKMAHRDGTHLLKMTHLRFRQFTVPHPSVTNLYRIVPIRSIRLYLGHDIPLFETHHRHSNYLSIRFEIAHHSQLGSHHANTCLHATHNNNHSPSLSFSTVLQFQDLA